MIRMLMYPCRLIGHFTRIIIMSLHWKHLDRGKSLNPEKMKLFFFLLVTAAIIVIYSDDH